MTQVGAFTAAADALDRAGVVWWLSDGSALGAVRDGTFIRTDTDVDIGFWYQDRPLVVEAFQQFDRHPSRDLKYVIGGVKVDLHPHVPDGDTVWFPLGIKERWRYRFPTFALEPTQFYGRAVNIPSPPDVYLSAHYGPDWRTPKSGWRWDQSPPCLEPEPEPEVRVSAVVMAHPKRREWAEQIAAELGCPVVWDRRNNLWDTARRSWLAYRPDATHHLVVQDDAILSPRLLDAATQAAAVAGRRPVSLYFGGLRPRLPETSKRLAEARALGLSWTEMDGPLWAVALMLPVADIDDMVAFGDRKTSIKADDTKINRFYRSRGMQCWYTVPSLVDHRAEDNPSLVGERSLPGRPRCSQWFIGEDRSGVEVDWTLLPEGFARRGAPVNTYKHVRTGKEVRVQSGSAPDRRLSAKPNHWARVSAAEPAPAEVPDEADALQAAHLGAGWYQTPDGGKVRGRAAAEAMWSNA